MDAFTFNTERLTAGREDMRLRCLADDPFGQLGCRVDHVLTVVEDQEELLVAYEGHKAPEWIMSLDHETKR